mgnify:CR=1 FL=1
MTASAFDQTERLHGLDGLRRQWRQFAGARRQGPGLLAEGLQQGRVALQQRLPTGGLRQFAATPQQQRDFALQGRVALHAQTGGPHRQQRRGRVAGGEVRLIAELDAGLADDVIRVAAAHPLTTGLGALFAPLTVNRA